ncbi:MAG: restriction endonuclease subunit S [Sedimenticola sp.]
MIPEGWKTQRLGDVLEKVTRPVKVQSNQIYREIGVRSHAKGIFHKEHVTGEALGNKRVFWVEPHCLVLNIVFAWEQAVSETNDRESGMIASHRFPMYRPRDNRSNTTYLRYYFSSPRGKYDLELASPGGAGRNKTLGQAEFNNLKLLLPPPPEQEKIAKILITWDKAIEKVEQLIEKSQEQKKALMQQLFTGEASHQFARRHLRDIADIDRHSLGTNTPDDFHFQYISLSDVSQGKISDHLHKHTFSDAPSRARKVVHSGDILLATVRPNLQSFARVYDDHEGFVASTGFSVITPHEKYHAGYIYHYLFGAHVSGQFHALVVGSNYPAINSSDVAGLLIYCPDFEEQHRISKVLDAADSTINSLIENKLALQIEKKALMQQLLTGKRRVSLSKEA